jgi:hypothetical protein
VKWAPKSYPFVAGEVIRKFRNSARGSSSFSLATAFPFLATRLPAVAGHSFTLSEVEGPLLSDLPVLFSPLVTRHFLQVSSRAQLRASPR